jgi:hypothetical protein
MCADKISGLDLTLAFGVTALPNINGLSVVKLFCSLTLSDWWYLVGNPLGEAPYPLVIDPPCGELEAEPPRGTDRKGGIRRVALAPGVVSIGDRNELSREGRVETIGLGGVADS